MNCIIALFILLITCSFSYRFRNMRYNRFSTNYNNFINTINQDDFPSDDGEVPWDLPDNTTSVKKNSRPKPINPRILISALS